MATSKATSASISGIAKQLSDLDINSKIEKPVRQPGGTLKKQLSHSQSTLKLASKYAPNKETMTATMSIAVKLASGDSQSQHSRTNSATVTAPPSPVRAFQKPLDIGQYDGGFEIENEKRGHKVYGEAAEDLALDSSRHKLVRDLLIDMLHVLNA